MIRLLTFLALWGAGLQAAWGAQVVVTVTDVHDNRGTIEVAICPPDEFLKPVCRYVGRAPAHPGAVVVTVENVPPGMYAAEAYQDANGNHILDRNWLGIPLEGMGFSNDAPFRFGPPSFADAAFRVTGDGAAIMFRLRYF